MATHSSILPGEFHGQRSLVMGPECQNMKMEAFLKDCTFRVNIFRKVPLTEMSRID